MTYDIIGTISQGGEWDDEGNVVTAPTVLPGWHVNAPAPVEGWEAYLLDPQPSTPFRVYAGHTPVCYLFPDEETFNSLVTEE